jgi:hypothetical protein
MGDPAETAASQNVYLLVLPDCVVVVVVAGYGFLA